MSRAACRLTPTLSSKTAVTALGAAMLALTAMHTPAGAAVAGQPVVVELFTSQGCSSCPPANQAVADLADRPDVLALSFGVTYWDALGWKDTFASPQFTARQWDYARSLRHTQVWTPQVVVDGRVDTVGQRPGQIEPLNAANQSSRTRADNHLSPQGIISVLASMPPTNSPSRRRSFVRIIAPDEINNCKDARLSCPLGPAIVR